MYPGSDLPKQESDNVFLGTMANVNLSDLVQVSSIEGNHVVTNETSGEYLWIVSRAQISDVMSDGMNVPIIYCGQYDGHYYYACPNPLQNITFNVTIKV